MHEPHPGVGATPDRRQLAQGGPDGNRKQPAMGRATVSDSMTTTGNSVVVIIGEDPWGALMHLDLKQWALAVAQRSNIVVYVGPPSRSVTVTLPDATVTPAQVAERVLTQWLETTGHYRRGIYFLERLDAVHVGKETIQPTPGLVERRLASWIRRPFSVVLGYEAAQWLGGGSPAVTRWPASTAKGALTPAAGLHAQLQAPLDTSPAHPVAVVVGVTAGNRLLLHQLMDRAAAWRFFVYGPAADGGWPPTAQGRRWPALADAEPPLLAASAVIIPPDADPSTVHAWCAWHTACSPTEDTRWVGPAPKDVRGTVLPAASLDDYSRALGLLSWPEPRTLVEARS